MNVSLLSTSSNTTSLTSGNTQSQSEGKTVNFGIGPNSVGSTKSTEVELSPQARILQQSEQNQRQAEQALQNRREKEAETPAKNEYIRVTSSIGRSSQSSRMTSDEALDAYRSIEKLI